MDNIQENTSSKKSFSLKKTERLSSKKIIDKLFAEGDALLQYPLKIVYLTTKIASQYPAQSAFTASKRSFKHAVTRNHIKRLLRESYRLNKHIIYDGLNNEQLAIFIIFIGKKIPQYEQVEAAMKKGLGKVINKLSTKENEHHITDWTKYT